MRSLQLALTVSWLGLVAGRLPSLTPPHVLGLRGGGGEVVLGAPPRIDDASQRVTVVTTASLPWMTGTAVNPLLRAAHLTTDRDAGAVTLLVPWVDEADQRKIFPNNITFASKEEQRAYVLKWVEESANMPAAARKLKVDFYEGKYNPSYGSIFSVGPYVEREEGDIAILEEPEHLSWYRYPEAGWMDKFEYVVGVMHTNYIIYARQERGLWATGPIWLLNQMMCRAQCHKTIKLSGTLQKYAPWKECVSNVHGVREAFFDAGRAASVAGFTGVSDPSTGRHAQCYFVSKQLWAKGYRLLFGLMEKYRKAMGGSGFAMDLYGSGPDSASIAARAKRSKLDIAMKGYADHAKLGRYRVFINPSITEVLCTTVAEALAMGKWVVCPKHPSNDFFAMFPNCLQYESEAEFVAAVHWALNHEPPPLLQEVRRELSWEAAMGRLAQAAAPTEQMRGKGNGRSWLDRALCASYTGLGRSWAGDLIRYLSGGGACAWQVTMYSPKKQGEAACEGKEAAQQGGRG